MCVGVWGGVGGGGSAPCVQLLRPGCNTSRPGMLTPSARVEVGSIGPRQDVFGDSWALNKAKEQTVCGVRYSTPLPTPPSPDPPPSNPRSPPLPVRRQLRFKQTWGTNKSRRVRSCESHRFSVQFRVVSMRSEKPISVTPAGMDLYIYIGLWP